MEGITKFFQSIAGNLIAALLMTLGSIFVGYYWSFSFEAKLIIVNIALVLSAIILILRNQYSPKRIRMVRGQVFDYTYLVENNVARHIPDPETFQYLGKLYSFHWGIVEVIPTTQLIRLTY